MQGFLAMNSDKIKQILHPTYLSFKLFFQNWKLFIWYDMYNLATLFTLVYLMQKWLLFGKLKLWILWTVTLVMRKILAGGFCEPRRRLNGCTVVITGADSGIGKEVAREFTMLGAHLVLGSRNLEKGEQTKRELEDLKGSVEVRQLDLSSLDSVRDFANGLIAHKYHLHMLANCAGEMGSEDWSTGAPNRQWNVNYLGPFLLTNMLLPWLTHTRPARIINVGASAHVAGDPSALTQTHPHDADWWQSYCNSKLATLLFTHHLAKKVKGTNVEVFCANPGLTPTRLFRRFLPEWVCESPIFGLLAQTPREAAQTIVHCATNASKNDSSYYYSECSDGWPSDDAQNDALAEKLWRWSEQMTQ